MNGGVGQSRFLRAACLLLLAGAVEAEAGFAFRKPVTIDGTRVVGGPHLDFPVLVTVVDPNLRTVRPEAGAERFGYDITFGPPTGPRSSTMRSSSTTRRPGPRPGCASPGPWFRPPGQNGVNTVFIYYGDPTIGCCQPARARCGTRPLRLPLHRWAKAVPTAPSTPRKTARLASQPQGDGALAHVGGHGARSQRRLGLTTPPTGPRPSACPDTRSCPSETGP
jgi:hypothetical protein